MSFRLFYRFKKLFHEDFACSTIGIADDVDAVFRHVNMTARAVSLCHDNIKNLTFEIFVVLRKMSKYPDISPPFSHAIRPASEQRGPYGVATGTPSCCDEHAAVMQRRPRCNAGRPLRQTARIAVVELLCVSCLVTVTYENRSKITNFDPKD